MVNTSRLFGDGGDSSQSSFFTEAASPVSAEGLGRGGRAYEKESAVSWMYGLVSVGDEAVDATEAFAERVGDMTCDDAYGRLVDLVSFGRLAFEMR